MKPDCDYDALFPKDWSLEILKDIDANRKLLWVLHAENPRALFDERSQAWGQVEIKTKIKLLTAFQDAGRLDGLIAEYIRRGRQHAPEYLLGLGPAIVSLSASGFSLKLPAVPMVGNITQAGFAASLSRLLEDGQMDSDDNRWLHIELKRLRVAIDTWLKAQPSRS